MWINSQCEFNNKYAVIPEQIRNKIKRYVEDRKSPGPFLTTLIIGDLFRTIRLSDPDKIEGLHSEEDFKELKLYRKHLILIAEWFQSYFPHLTGRENYIDWVMYGKDD